MSHPQISGGCKSRFHPTKAVLACGSGNGQVTIFKAANQSVPFSDWRIEREFKGRKSGWIKALEWNVRYFRFFTQLIISSVLKFLLRRRRAVARHITCFFI